MAKASRPAYRSRLVTRMQLSPQATGVRSAKRVHALAYSANKLVDSVGDALGGVAQLLHGPVGGIALRDVLGRGMVDQPLGQA